MMKILLFHIWMNMNEAPNIEARWLKTTEAKRIDFEIINLRIHEIVEEKRQQGCKEGGIISKLVKIKISTRRNRKGTDIAKKILRNFSTRIFYFREWKEKLFTMRISSARLVPYSCSYSSRLFSDSIIWRFIKISSILLCYCQWCCCWCCKAYVIWNEKLEKKYPFYAE